MLIAVAGLICVTLILFGARLGLWQPIVGFGLYRTYFNAIGAGIFSVGLFALAIHFGRGEKGWAAVGGVVALLGLVFLFPLISSTVNPQPRAAPIHDITTDTANPPAFEVLDETRAGARNTLEYGGAEVADQQATAYPDIAPLQTPLTANAAFERALEVAGKMGWEIVATAPSRHRFEATARTSVFYFADDIVVAVIPAEDGSRVDMRGVSRVGGSDQGVNADRIRTFQQQFQKD
ncbi:hypothetical protein DSM110093_02618 [Sulfitobacter sp. DSM 110093]|nr:hypothetical protein DSM110093_02618 [Sulfitobacter sp. DSM 110093]